MAYPVTETPMIRYDIGDYTILWVQSRNRATCACHRNTGPRQVGQFQVPSEWLSGSDPKATEAWRSLPARRTGSVCRPCATGIIAQFSDALAKIDEATL